MVQSKAADAIKLNAEILEMMKSIDDAIAWKKSAHSSIKGAIEQELRRMRSSVQRMNSKLVALKRQAEADVLDQLAADQIPYKEADLSSVLGYLRSEQRAEDWDRLTGWERYMLTRLSDHGFRALPKLI